MRNPRAGTAAVATSAAVDFLTGGGEMGVLMRTHDWSKSPLGPPARWPQSLKTTVSLLISSRFPMFLAWGDELAFLYNDSYSPILGAKHPAALGQPFGRVWSDIWGDIKPLVDKALAGEATFHADLPLVMLRNGYPEETFFTFSYSPVRDETGGVAGMFCACTETTGEVKARLTLKAEQERLRELFRQAPGFMCVVRGSQHVFELTNDAYLQLVGHRDLVGKTVREALPEVQGQGFYELLDRVYESGETFVGRRLPLSIQREPGGPLEQRFIDFVYQPIGGPDGRVTGIFVEGSDVTDLKQAEDRRQLLIRELHHRVKNTLATVQAIMGSTARASATIAEFQASFVGRIASLAKTHSLLTEDHWQSVEFRELLSAELSPYDDGSATRILLSGPNVELPSQIAVPLGMALHELTTNAAKYGALSELGGAVEVKWSISSGDAGRVLHWRWTESGGPRVEPPTREGFGSRLLQRVLGAQIQAKVEIDFAPEGLRMSAAVPLVEAG